MVVIANKGPRKKPRQGVTNFTKWKQEAIQMLLEDDELMKLLCYSTEDCLAKPAPTEDEREALIYKQIYPYRFIDEISENKMSYISMGMSNFVPQEGFRQFSDDYIQGYFYFHILVDRSIIKTDTGCRNDLILSRVYDIFQEKRVIGMGECRMETMLELWQQNGSYGGYTIGFRVVDLK